MKFHAVKTDNGLIPATEDDWDKFKRLKRNTVHDVTIKETRNYEFHKKYFALIKCAWEYQNEAVVNHFRNNMDNFRKSIEMNAGHYDEAYSIDRKEWIQTPKSISFEALSESEFQDLYDRVLDILFKVFLKNVPEQEFLKNLANF